jgi:coproporphyrinogen III oxidase-like Fe-S oxidoreductase
VDVVQAIVERIRSYFVVDDALSVGMEVNPSTSSARRLEDYKRIGITRVSIGVQVMYVYSITWIVTLQQRARCTGT